MMNLKMMAVINAVVAVYFWCQPFNYVVINRFFGEMYQSGEHWGGMGYLLLALPIAFAICTWFEQKGLAAIFAVTNMCIVVIVFQQIWKSAGWGIVGLAVCGIVALIINRKTKRANQSR